MAENSISLKYVKIDNEFYFKISNVDKLRPFFMSIVSDSDHWLFLSSNGGISAGRKDMGNALFPYYTDDKIIESFENTGGKTILWVEKSGRQTIWEPFSDRYTGMYNYSRNLYKSVNGNKLIFEEFNYDLGLTFKVQWNTSQEFGFVKKNNLQNNTDENISIQILDGLQNIMPHGVDPDLQRSSSNLIDAYKKSELIAESGLGIYSLSAKIVDRAEPSESLTANLAWSIGLPDSVYFLSNLQIYNFRNKKPIYPELDVRAERGAYFACTNIEMPAKQHKEWMIVSDVNKGVSDIICLSEIIKLDNNLWARVQADIDRGTQNLLELVAAADALQLSSDFKSNARHYANVLFNIMRGGIFDDNYHLEKADLLSHIHLSNKKVYHRELSFLKSLPDIISLQELRLLVEENANMNLIRLCYEYLPLKFSRRHGDPSRPWNKFSINIRNEIDGSKILDYQGNWRDLFQNWEALAHSFPEYIDAMIFKFLNASTFDGYNPYRVSKMGFDWESIEADDPWSYIGYWGDHQIIYLLKFLEFIENYFPGRLLQYIAKDSFVYANVPYKIKSYQAIVENPKDTIKFDQEADSNIRRLKESMGQDGALLLLNSQDIYHVNFIEKVLATLLAKISNFIPDGGIWMNTQRPEWNDANNALVGNGISMVTLYYLRRFSNFFKNLLNSLDLDNVLVSKELENYFKKIKRAFTDYLSILNNGFDNGTRKDFMHILGNSASDYRNLIYVEGFSGQKLNVRINELIQFSDLLLKYIDKSISANKRVDNLFHSYNLLTLNDSNEARISHLSEMLEGQVAVLSSGYLSAENAVEVLDALKNSNLFRPDQYSYLLYPDKNLPQFIDRNNIPEQAVQDSVLLQKLLLENDKSLIEKDIKGGYHFNRKFNNKDSLSEALTNLKHSYPDLIEKESKYLIDLFEQVFNHKAFTGRSGTFYGYEGLGSIYWHMVSKLLLAVQENCHAAIEVGESSTVVGRMLDHYFEIKAGIGVHKSPKLYGAFPVDPYSHTPGGKGAQQPGMTGQVKEDILTRFGELGMHVKNGQLHFEPKLLKKEEFLNTGGVFNYIDLYSCHKHLILSADELAFTYCQTPVIYKIADQTGVELVMHNNELIQYNSMILNNIQSKNIFDKNGEIILVRVKLTLDMLK